MDPDIVREDVAGEEDLNDPSIDRPSRTPLVKSSASSPSPSGEAPPGSVEPTSSVGRSDQRTSPASGSNSKEVRALLKKYDFFERKRQGAYKPAASSTGSLPPPPTGGASAPSDASVASAPVGHRPGVHASESHGPISSKSRGTFKKPMMARNSSFILIPILLFTLCRPRPIRVRAITIPTLLSSSRAHPTAISATSLMVWGQSFIGCL